MPSSRSSTSNSRLSYFQALVANEDYKALLVEVLSYLHRDGGQYTALAGYAVSVEDGIKNYLELRTQLTDLKFRLKLLEKQ